MCNMCCNTSKCSSSEAHISVKQSSLPHTSGCSHALMKRSRVVIMKYVRFSLYVCVILCCDVSENASLTLCIVDVCIRFPVLPQDVPSSWSGPETQQLPVSDVLSQQRQTHRYPKNTPQRHATVHTPLHLYLPVCFQGPSFLLGSLAEASLARRCACLKRKDRTSLSYARSAPQTNTSS